MPQKYNPNKKQKRRTVSMRPIVFQRLLDAAEASGTSIAATAEAAVTMFCDHHGIATPTVVRYLADKDANSRQQRERQEQSDLAEWKAHFTW